MAKKITVYRYLDNYYLGCIVDAFYYARRTHFTTIHLLRTTKSDKIDDAVRWDRVPKEEKERQGYMTLSIDYVNIFTVTIDTVTMNVLKIEEWESK